MKLAWLVNPDPNGVFKRIPVVEDRSVPKDHAMFIGDGGRKWLLDFQTGSLTEIETSGLEEQNRMAMLFKLQPSGPKISSTQLRKRAQVAAFHYTAIAVKTAELEAAFKRQMEADRDVSRILGELETLQRDAPQVSYRLNDAIEGKDR